MIINDEQSGEKVIGSPALVSDIMSGVRITRLHIQRARHDD